MNNVYRFLSILISLFCLSACDNDEQRISEEEQARLLNLVQANQALWESRGVNDYSVEYTRWHTFCDGSDTYDDLVVEVVNGEVHATYLNDKDFDRRIEEPGIVGLSIDDMFSFLIEEINKQPAQLTQSSNSSSDPTFDEFFGYPTSYYLRSNREEIGNECNGWRVEVTKFY